MNVNRKAIWERDFDDSDESLRAKSGKIGSEGVKIKFETRRKK